MFGFGKKKEPKVEMPRLVEGGDFKCFIHGFVTSNPEVWDRHCVDTKHRVSGETTCPLCGTRVVFKDAPYAGIGKPIHILCDTCKEDVGA